MTSNYNIIEEEAEELEHKNETSYSIYLGFILHYITFTNYYIVQDTFRREVITEQ